MNSFLATYIHDLSPYLVRFKGDIGIRWYGLTYVMGFLAAFFLIRWFIKLKACELKQEKVSDFITIVAIFGVMLGGRLGYMLFYTNGEFFKNPLMFFKFLDGGMASHGAIFGLMLVVFLYARWQKLSWLGLGDNLVITGVAGVFFGRWGNFINGELYGRITPAKGAAAGTGPHPWAMKFPAELFRFQSSDLLALVERAKNIAPELSVNVKNAIAANGGLVPRVQIAQMIIATSRKNEEFKLMMGEILNHRHPSQIYQALCEGLLVFLILLVIRVKWRNAWHGFISGVFFISYAIARIFVENFREPDAGSPGKLGLTDGQFYSLFMILTGAILIAWSCIKRRTNSIPE